ncbi:hypothetical protein EVC45_24875 [Paraburkholderia sp. UYCP14C]|uniref:hypothetical protein n=1 Tax=Paraburkholderia sp. UYCP14C TaxID=2511130 RepID=UPI00101FA507|nr:hypothetical protein [Paraburkholderia sp. UYCP14C]RZF27048.1 hypothetical protein EVC45_24875 [Paraburkholderia sp. UYCP14C]
MTERRANSAMNNGNYGNSRKYLGKTWRGENRHSGAAMAWREMPPWNYTANDTINNAAKRLTQMQRIPNESRTANARRIMKRKS